MRQNLMIDGAHNQESIAALVAVMKNYTEKPIKILVAAINTKPAAAMLEQLEEIGQVSVTTFDYPRALTLQDYPDKYTKIVSWQEWVNEAKSPDVFYLITGSLYFISQVRQYITKELA